MRIQVKKWKIRCHENKLENICCHSIWNVWTTESVKIERGGKQEEKRERKKEREIEIERERGEGEDGVKKRKKRRAERKRVRTMSRWWSTYLRLNQ